MPSHRRTVSLSRSLGLWLPSILLLSCAPRKARDWGDFDILALSGGGALGAFGAGVLQGWTERPEEFDVKWLPKFKREVYRQVLADFFGV